MSLLLKLQQFLAAAQEIHPFVILNKVDRGKWVEVKIVNHTPDI